MTVSDGWTQSGLTNDLAMNGSFWTFFRQLELKRVSKERKLLRAVHCRVSSNCGIFFPTSSMSAVFVCICDTLGSFSSAGLPKRCGHPQRLWLAAPENSGQWLLWRGFCRETSFLGTQPFWKMQLIWLDIISTSLHISLYILHVMF